ncbi:hypothetical protein RFI_13592 [Reticulomyxa filosa]|uniref:Uncharacterized protein n=1 Tax=Reticulomyxa filosa TaxID=46433 RepID=X6NCG2_RETFI|nr:hypothetical protein RFI_13592 [Reticulomyxa filosa]|eukprot:ETO23588.1 hypothetical protein RFI_13592 [Reticulomyxa filosa]
MKYPDDKKQEVESIELDINIQWNKAYKEAYSMFYYLIWNGQEDIVIFFQDISFTEMINSNKYLKEKKEFPQYNIYLFRSSRITFDNIIIDGCVYVANCAIDAIGYFHIINTLCMTHNLIFVNFLTLYCNYLKKMKQENLTFKLVDMKDNIIDFDEAVKQAFVSNETSYKILWRPIINENHKIIAIGEYIDNTK